MTRSLRFAALILPFAAGCFDAAAVATQPVPQGDFAFAFADPEDVVADQMAISVDTEALGLVVTLQDGSTVESALELLAADASYTDCYTNTSHATMDTYDVLGDAIVVDGEALQSPVLTSKCGSRPMLGEWSAESSTFDGVILYFE